VFARLHTLEGTREQHERGQEIIRDEYLPWVRDSTGFRGLIALLDGEHQKAIVITLWADETALDDSAAAGDRLSRLAAAAAGSTRRSLESFEVTLFEVRSDR
jgi:heme-degrading monooxygenase HmoA